jgi:UDP-N-acetylmuramate--alanine ligase
MLNNKSYFFIGIKGVMMANMAVILKKMGHIVTGTDIEEEFITDSLLKKENIKYFTGFSPEIIPQSVDCVVYAASHGGINNPIVIEAKKRNIKVIHQAELLGEIMGDFNTKIAVCGCHGKTTTSSLLSHALLKLNAKPSYCVGVPYFGEIEGSNYLGNNYFVVEADEYGVNPPLDKTPKFNFLNPDHIICTNIDFDHPDVYRDLEETKNAFFNFFAKTVRNHPQGDRKKQLILCIDDLNTFQSIDPSTSLRTSRLKQDRYITYGTNEKADYQITNIKTIDNGTQFELFNNFRHSGKPKSGTSNVPAAFDAAHPESDPGPIKILPDFQGKQARMTFYIPLYGEKNVLNATAVIVMLLQLGFKPVEIRKALIGFRGAERRLQKIYEGNGIQLFDDYAHHPNEIKASIDALRKRFPNNRLIIIFQPHTYSRTKSLLKEFASSLSQADLTYVLPIFASAREKQDQTIDASAIAKLSPKKITSFDNAVQSIELLKMEMQSGDVIVTMGAGDVYKMADKIIKVILEKKTY